MNELICKNCGEPYSVFHLKHDCPDDDAYERMMRGEGCPACDWGDQECADIHDEGNEQRHLRSLFSATDDDPTKFL